MNDCGQLLAPLGGKAPPERDNFLRFQVYERVGILLVEVYEKGREIRHLGLPYGFIKLRKRSIFVIDSYLNGSAFTALNNIQEKSTQF